MGRPKSDNVLTPAQRVARSRKVLVEGGGRILPHIALDPEDACKFEALKRSGGHDSDASLVRHLVRQS